MSIPSYKYNHLVFSQAVQRRNFWDGMTNLSFGSSSGCCLYYYYCHLNIESITEHYRRSPRQWCCPLQNYFLISMCCLFHFFIHFRSFSVEIARNIHYQLWLFHVKLNFICFPDDSEYFYSKIEQSYNDLLYISHSEWIMQYCSLSFSMQCCNIYCNYYTFELVNTRNHLVVALIV